MSISTVPVPPPKTSDEELLRLAEASIAPPVQAPVAPIPVDAPLPTVPNGPAVEGPIEMPGDRAMETVAPPVPPAPIPVAPVASANLPGADALAAARTSDMATADAKAAESASRSEQANSDAEVAQSQADQFRANEAEIRAEDLAQQEGTARATEIADEASKQYKDFKFHDWWQQSRNADGSYRDKSLGERIAANIFLALGDLAKGPGEENQALKRINGTIEQWAARDRAELAQKYNFARLKSEGVEQFMAQRKQDMAILQLRQAALTNATADEARAQLIRNKVPVSEAENNTMVMQLRATADEKYAKGLADLISDQAKLAMSNAHLRIAQGQLAVAQKNSQKADVPSESEGNNAARGRNMSLALDNLEKSGLSNHQPDDKAFQKWFLNQELIEGARENNKNPSGQIANAFRRKFGGENTRIPANELEGLSDDDRKYFALMRQVVEPYARKQSGAAISSSEWQNFASQTGLGSGEFGRQLREQAARDMQTLGGRATKQLEAADKERGVETPGAASVNKKPPADVAPSDAYVTRAREVLSDPGKYSKDDVVKAAQIIDKSRAAKVK